MLAAMSPRGDGATLVAALTVVAALACLPVPAQAAGDDPAKPGASALEDARWHFTEGAAHYQARRFEEALAAFQRSYELVESPNTELMIARSLREVGRRADAVAAFEHAATEADRRVARGETKYKPTGDAARSEGGALRNRLGTVVLRVAAPTESTVTVDGRAIPLLGREEVSFLHEPGTVTVLVREANGAEQRQTVNVLPGSTVQMQFAADSSSPPPPPAPPPAAPRATASGAWTTPAAWISGGVTVAGLGVFTLFGLQSASIYDDLEQRCGPSNCGPADRDDAARGERAQTVANVGLVVAAVAAVATVTFVVLGASSRPSAAVTAPRRAARFAPAARPGL